MMTPTSNKQSKFDFHEDDLNELNFIKLILIGTDRPPLRLKFSNDVKMRTLTPIEENKGANPDTFPCLISGCQRNRKNVNVVEA